MTRSLFSPVYREMRELLVDARQEAGLTQTEVARRLKRPQSYVSKLESGERRIDLVEFLDVVAAIGADPVEIVATLARWNETASPSDPSTPERAQKRPTSASRGLLEADGTR